MLVAAVVPRGGSGDSVVPRGRDSVVPRGSSEGDSAVPGGELEGEGEGVGTGAPREVGCTIVEVVAVDDTGQAMDAVGEERVNLSTK